MIYYILFTILGFSLGSTMFAYWIPKLFKKVDICQAPKDHNPGVANAFTYGGFWVGILALFCELGKGFLPVFMSQSFVSIDSLLFIPVMAAPVFGHAFPFFQTNKGGKAIAVSFGVTMGLFPEVRPLFYLVVFFLFFSIVLVVSPHSFRSVLTFGLFAILVFLRVDVLPIRLGCSVIAGIVILKHWMKAEGQRMRIRLVRRME